MPWSFFAPLLQQNCSSCGSVIDLVINYLFIYAPWSLCMVFYSLQAGSIEGQVVEMGLTTTSLLNAEKFPVIVPNSMFSSQVHMLSTIFHFQLSCL